MLLVSGLDDCRLPRRLFRAEVLLDDLKLLPLDRLRRSEVWRERGREDRLEDDLVDGAIVLGTVMGQGCPSLTSGIPISSSVTSFVQNS